MPTPTLQEILAEAKAESEKNAQAEINAWAQVNGDAAEQLRKLWNKHLVLGHKALARMLLGKPAKAKKPGVPEED